MTRLLRFVERRVRAIVWLTLLGWIGYIGVSAASGARFRPGWIGTLLVLFVACGLLAAWVDSRRRMAIRESPLPAMLKRKLRETYPHLQPRDADLVERGFRQFFLACARSGGKLVAMPSKAVDAYWHAFILDTRAYASWYERTLGRFLHHRPTERLGSDAERNDALRRAWFFACRDEAIDPRRPSRLPLLFALDGKLAIPGGVAYLTSSRLPGSAEGAGGAVDVSSVSDFADDAVAGDAGGMGGVDASGGDGGDGGGCGGGD